MGVVFCLSVALPIHKRQENPHLYRTWADPRHGSVPTGLRVCLSVHLCRGLLHAFMHRSLVSDHCLTHGRELSDRIF